jgi:hypothetical protein
MSAWICKHSANQYVRPFSARRTPSLLAASAPASLGSKAKLIRQLCQFRCRKLDRAKRRLPASPIATQKIAAKSDLVCETGRSRRAWMPAWSITWHRTLAAVPPAVVRGSMTEFERGWAAAMEAVQKWHEGKAHQALIQARRSRFPKNFEREAEVHQRSAEQIAALSPDDV